MIKIRKATLADKQKIFEFLSKAYEEKAQYKYPERWEWQFEHNPFRHGDELPIWLAVDEDDTIVGQTCAMFEPLKIGATIYHVSWAVDTVLLPNFRGQKLGFKLQKTRFDDSEIFLSLSMGKASRHINLKVGCFPLDTVSVFVRMAHFDARSIFAALQERLLNNWAGNLLLTAIHFFRLDQLAAVFINKWIEIFDSKLSRYIDPDIDIRQIEQFDESVDDFWDTVSTHFLAIVQRKSNYLNWKYVQQPHMDYQLFTGTRDGKMCGYVILRKTRHPESNLGIIADLFVPIEDKKAIDTLLTYAVQQLKRQKVKYIMAASSVRVYKNTLQALGFKNMKEIIPMFHSQIETPDIKTALTSGTWFFGRSDHDWDQYPYA